MACNRFCLCKRQINVLLGICISFQMFLSLSFAHFDAVIFLVDGQEVLCGRRTLPGLGGAHSLQGALGARAAERGSPPVCGQRTLARAARWVHLDLPPRVPNLLLPPSSKDGELGRGPTWASKASSGERSLRDRSRLINSTFVRGPRAFKTDVGLFLLPPCPPRPWGASGDAALVSRKAPPAGRPHLRGGAGGWGRRVLVF